MKNLNDLSGHPSPYNVPIIPLPLPLEIVEGEHFFAADLLSLIPGGSSPSREAESEVAGRELMISTQPAQPSSTSEDSDPAPQASRQVEGGSCLERPRLAIKDSRLAPRASKKKKRTLRLQKVAGAWAEDFISWVSPISCRSLDREEEEE